MLTLFYETLSQLKLHSYNENTNHCPESMILGRPCRSMVTIVTVSVPGVCTCFVCNTDKGNIWICTVNIVFGLWRYNSMYLVKNELSNIQYVIMRHDKKQFWKAIMHIISINLLITYHTQKTMNFVTHATQKYKFSAILTPLIRIYTYIQFEPFIHIICYTFQQWYANHC